MLRQVLRVVLARRKLPEISDRFELNFIMTYIFNSESTLLPFET